MKRVLRFFIMCLIMIGCKNVANVYKCNGLEGEPVYMFFKTTEEGYSFGNIIYFEEMNRAQLSDPYFTPKSTYEANIYKTTDGGKNWIKIDSVLNYS